MLPDPCAALPSAASIAPSLFARPDLLSVLQALDDAALDALDVGVIGFDADGRVRRYNRFESQAAGLRPERVLGHHMFIEVAPCMNNFMVAQQFEDQRADGGMLDSTLDYVLTLRMLPVKVVLRLLASPASPMRYVVVRRQP